MSVAHTGVLHVQHKQNLLLFKMAFYLHIMVTSDGFAKEMFLLTL